MVNTKIQWCDSTVNPVMGCHGCELWNESNETCYAAKLHRMRSNHSGFARDFLTPETFPGRMSEAARLSDLTGLPRLGEHPKPWLDGQPRMIFVSDMGDALSSSIPFEYLENEIIDAVNSADGQRHRWLWLTKRPKRMGEFCEWLGERGVEWPANLWPGTSVTSSATKGRIAQLERVGTERTIRFLSVEPQWEPVDLGLREHPGIGWVIQGGESGARDRVAVFGLDMARQMRDTCAEHGVPYFLKQLGAFPVESVADPKRDRLAIHDSHGGDWDEWPEDLRVRQLPGALATTDVAAVA